MTSTCILGTGSYLPSRVLTNADLNDLGIDTTDEWIVKRTGISERRIAAPDETTADMGCDAAKKALDMAGLTANDLDLIVVATITPDTCCPSAANWLQAKLGASRAVSFDVTAACSGFIFALNVAEQYLKSGASKTILVTASEVMSRTFDWKDRSTCILWGDGAGAAVLRPGPGGHEILSTHIHTDGGKGQDLLPTGGGSRTTPISHESVVRGIHLLSMSEANLSFRAAVKYFMESIEETAASNQVSVEDIDWFIPHQANLRMFRFIAEKMKVPMEKFYLTLQKYGNVSSASCAISLDCAVRDGSVKEDDLICLPVFGGGLTWGGR